jgi:serine protease Do
MAVATGIVLAAVSGQAKAERILLRSGAEINAPILKSDNNSVVVDLGCEVVRVPRSEVVKIIRPEEAAASRPGPATRAGATTRPGATTRAVAEDKGPDWQLYRTAKLEPTTIEANSERFGQAVVMVTTPAGQGSGFIITDDGHMITNYHVIAQETKIKVTVFHKTDRGYEQKLYAKVKIVAMNPFLDLALVKIQEPGVKFSCAYLGDIKAVEAGQEVFAIGNPLGLTRTVSQGIISTKNRNFDGQLYIQTTTDINPGNSGGPLFNMRGEVIGVTSMGYLYLGGLNFAIPVDVVKRFIENRDAFAYDEDNPNSGHRYLQPAGRQNRGRPPEGKTPALGPIRSSQAPEQGDKKNPLPIVP